MDPHISKDDQKRVRIKTVKQLLNFRKNSAAEGHNYYRMVLLKKLKKYNVTRRPVS